MAPSPPCIVDVLTPVAVDTAYSYRVPASLDLRAGDLVCVPLGAHETIGVVWQRRSGAGANLKEVAGRVDIHPLPESLRNFVDWVARWTLAPRGMVLRMAVRAAQDTVPETPRIGVRTAGNKPSRLTPARARAMEAAAGGFAMSKRDLARMASCSPGVIDGLVDDGALEAVLLPRDAEPAPDADFAPPSLDRHQTIAAMELVKRVKEDRFSVTLLEGVTGSGKTEVYFEAVAAALAVGRQALILMPEIALTSQFLDRFARRFGARPAEWHSAVSPRRRKRLWSATAGGEAKAVVGARSALFLPFRDLGVIIVDEEHEAAYKQEDGVAYHARDMAVVRARIGGCALALASATPSLETRFNVERGRYGRLCLPARFGGRALPDLAAIDMRRQAPARGKWLSAPLEGAVRAALERGEQALLFLNRRGYAPLTLCRACGHRFQCPNCSAWLVEHRFRRALVCHHCGHIERRPETCLSCGETESLAACGPGVERLADEAAELFPDARVLTLSSDFPGGTERLRQELQAVARGDADIVIGTQLVAKGHNFPKLTLVGVVDADVGLASGDPRAGERTFQLLQQVTGRAGRGARAGRGLLQTWQPEHPVIRALLSGEAEQFYQEETQTRRRADMPPFGRLAALIVSGRDRGAADGHSRALARAAAAMPETERWGVAAAGGAPGPRDVTILGPAEAPIAVIRGKHRFRLLVRAPLAADLQGFLRAWLAASPPARGGVRVVIDVDPQSFL